LRQKIGVSTPSPPRLFSTSLLHEPLQPPQRHISSGRQGGGVAPVAGQCASPVGCPGSGPTRILHAIPQRRRRGRAADSRRRATAGPGAGRDYAAGELQCNAGAPHLAQGTWGTDPRANTRSAHPRRHRVAHTHACSPTTCTAAWASTASTTCSASGAWWERVRSRKHHAKDTRKIAPRRTRTRSCAHRENARARARVRENKAREGKRQRQGESSPKLQEH